MITKLGAPDTLKLAHPVLSVKADASGQLSGYASAFGVQDRQGDVVMPGAFAKSLAAWRAKARAVPILWQHDAREPIGAWTELKEDDRGLRAVGKLNLDTQRGREARALASQGAITGLSIGFVLVDGGFDRLIDAYVIKAVDLYEISLVTFPANDDARVSSVKSALSHIGSAVDLERALRDRLGCTRGQAKALARGGWPALASCDPDEPDESHIHAFLARLDKLARDA